MTRYRWEISHPAIDKLHADIGATRERVLAHPIYSSLTSVSAVRIFMEHHVFAVWDFMSLLKSLQRSLTGIQLPWVPVGDVVTRRLINEIVLVEESDEYGDGFLSHFELYLRGMTAAGADTSAISTFLGRVVAGAPLEDATAGVPEPAQQFVTTTWSLIRDRAVHCQAAAFAFGREDLIPEMFERVVSIDDQRGDLEVFVDYLTRHIAVDGEQHTPMAMQMLVNLCGDDDARWNECSLVVDQVLKARIALWDGIHAAIMSSEAVPAR